mmetsp:Transcript_19311/g.58424  ORF Transcript_19311/g.58424 Transcript_19311/m.58424 type:complete len:318 (-) Transcript_19311:96-1049(-)
MLKAPKLWPAVPVSVMSRLAPAASRPPPPRAAAISPPMRPPTQRSVLHTDTAILAAIPFGSSAPRSACISGMARMSSSSVDSTSSPSAGCALVTSCAGLSRCGLKLSSFWPLSSTSALRFAVLATGCSSSLRAESRLRSPTTSSRLRLPSLDSTWRTSSATKRKYCTTCSGSAGNFSRSFIFCVVTPTGQVLRWQTRAMTQPPAIMAMVPKPNSSAPMTAPSTTSQPVLMPPSTRRVTFSRRPFSSRLWCTSVRPSSQGEPACLMDDSGDAPVPPSWPDTWITSALALATPQATVPMPTSDTSLTLTSAEGCTILRS